MRTSVRVASRLLGASAVVVVLTACTFTISTPAPTPRSVEPPPPTAWPSSPSTPTPTSSSRPKVSWAELRRTTEITPPAVNRFWREHWTEALSDDAGMPPTQFPTGSYRPPHNYGLYDGRRTSGIPTCNGSPLTVDQASYCPSDRSVAWDEQLMRRGLEVGDGWAYLIVAHEYGHAVQDQLPNSPVDADHAETQADCLAAAALYGATADGHLNFTAENRSEVVEALTRLADRTPWTRSGSHGDAAERISAFSRGQTGGMAACLR